MKKFMEAAAPLINWLSTADDEDDEEEEEEEAEDGKQQSEEPVAEQKATEA